MPKRRGRPPGVVLDGLEVKRLRVGLGLTTAQVAGRIGCDPQTVRRAERDNTISDVLASRLAKILGVTIADITTDKDASEPELKAPAA